MRLDFHLDGDNNNDGYTNYQAIRPTADSTMDREQALLTEASRLTI